MSTISIDSIFGAQPPREPRRAPTHGPPNRSTARQTLAALSAFLVASLCLACDDGGSSESMSSPATPPPASDAPEPTPAPPPEEAPVPVAATLESLPAEVVSVSLEGLGLATESVLVGQPTIGTPASEPANLANGQPRAIITEGSIRFANPGDTGEDATYRISLDSPAGGELIDVEVVVRSTRQRTFTTLVESAEGASGPVSPDLEASGFGPGNTVGDSGLRFAVPGAPALDPQASRALVRDGSGVLYRLSDEWTFDPGENALEVSLDSLLSFLDPIPAGDLDLTVNLVSQDFEFAAVYDLRIIKPQASIEGMLVDSGGLPVVSDEPIFVALIGASSDLRRIVEVDDEGRFTFESLISETYTLSVVDLERPGIFTAIVPIFEDTSTAEATLLYEPEGVPAALRAVAPATPQYATPDSEGFEATMEEELPSSMPAVVGRVSQDGTPTRPRFQAAEAATLPASECSEAIDNGIVFSAISGNENETNACLVEFISDSASSLLTVEIVVTSTEFPDFTQNDGNPFDDRWGYSLTVANATQSLIRDEGNVNASHRNTGMIQSTVCLERTAGATAPISVSGSISSINIGDAAFSTDVAVTLRPGCGDLSISDAFLGSLNASSHFVVRPRTLGNTNASGRFVSFPNASPQSAWGIPLDVRYAPANAMVDEMRVAVVRQGQIVAETGNLLTGGATASNGRIELRDFIMPQLAFPIGAGEDVALSVQLVGSVENSASESPPGDVNVRFGQNRNFTPLLLAEESVGSSDRRYGTGFFDAGDDNWATVATIDWLTSRTYRYNDVSALHVAQLANGESVLGHSGHSDGRQIDLRYVDPEGGNADFGTTSVINGFIDSAQSDAIELQRLSSWVQNNRAAIEDEADDASRIYVGRGRVGRALIQGRLPNGNLIPNVGAWTTRPDQVYSAASHINHWHISLSQ